MKMMFGVIIMPMKIARRRSGIRRKRTVTSHLTTENSVLSRRMLPTLPYQFIPNLSIPTENNPQINMETYSVWDS